MPTVANNVIQTGVTQFEALFPTIAATTLTKAFKAAALHQRTSEPLSALARAWLIINNQLVLTEKQVSGYAKKLTVGVTGNIHPDICGVIGRHFGDLKLLEGQNGADIYANAIAQKIDVLFDPITINKGGGNGAWPAAIAATRARLKEHDLAPGPLVVQAHLDPKNFAGLKPIALHTVIDASEKERDVIQEIAAHFQADHQVQLYPLRRGGREYLIVRKKKQGQTFYFPDWVGEKLADIVDAHMVPAYVVIGPEGPVPNTNPCLVGSGTIPDQRCIIRAGRNKAVERLGEVFNADPDHKRAADALSVAVLHMGLEDGDKTLADSLLEGVEIPREQPRPLAIKPPEPRIKATKGRDGRVKQGTSEHDLSYDMYDIDRAWDTRYDGPLYNRSHEM
jgi:hypothetical protein